MRKNEPYEAKENLKLRKAAMTKLYHIAISKDAMLNMLKSRPRYSYRMIFDAHRGDAMKLLEADTREWITLEPCDNQSPNGECEGHGTK